MRKRRVAMGMSASLILVAGVISVVARAEYGTKLDEFRGVAVYDNGPIIAKSHGRNYAKDGYYYGQKWQCVEFVKRFFYQAHHHRMPDVWGHARDFFDDSVAHGDLNQSRGLIQFRNGREVAPLPGDLVVFTNGFYGHVAIVSAVTSNQVEVIQQNIPGRPRDLYALQIAGGKYTVGTDYRPAGWLRVPARK